MNPTRLSAWSRADALFPKGHAAGSTFRSSGPARVLSSKGVGQCDRARIPSVKARPRSLDKVLGPRSQTPNAKGQRLALSMILFHPISRLLRRAGPEGLKR